MALTRTKVRIGEELIKQNKLTKEQLEEALDEQKKKRSKFMLGEILVDMGFVTTQDVVDVLKAHIGVDFVDLMAEDTAGKVDERAVHFVTEDMARKNSVFPYRFDEKDANLLLVAMADPLNYDLIDDIYISSNCRVQPMLAQRKQINTMIDRYFGKVQAQAVAEQFLKEQQEFANDMDLTSSRQEEIENSPIVKVVRNLIEQAARERASDIHIEPFEYKVEVRFRIDGVLRHVITYDKSVQSAITARLKVIGGMDISEKRKPQDGRITLLVDNHEYDIRVSCLPTVFGEKVVMRLALKEGFNRDKKELGLRPEDMEMFDSILKNTHGIILVTGPTGSGKSTTLYTALSELSTEEVNIVTVEDPVEANVEGVNQVQVNPKAELTFASALRSILRQDPDIIMIGEIRDGETAQIAVQASITGHLVVSTLHTNSTGATISRLVDMGVEPYLLGDSLVGIIAQRLVRKLCTCAKEDEATLEEKRMLNEPEDKPLRIKKPVGCPLCGNTGYNGRVGIYEIMRITNKVRNLIAKSATSDEIMKAAEEEGMSTLRNSAKKYVLEGVTSVEELVRATFGSDDYDNK